MGAERALNTIEVELGYRLERMKEQVVVRLVDGSTNTSSGVDVDGRKGGCSPLGSAATPLVALQKSINARTRLHVHRRPLIGSDEQKSRKAL
jgi:hypothetical protein